MGVHDDVPGVEVAIQINGTDVVEHDDPEADQTVPLRPTSTKYIESIDDAAFGVRFTVHREYAWGYENHLLEFGLRVDGQYVDGFLLEQNNDTLTETMTTYPRFCADSQQWMDYAMYFSPVSTVDESSARRLAADLKVAKTLGVIEVSVRRLLMLHKVDDPPKRAAVTAQGFELAEKSFKGRDISHGTVFRPEQRASATRHRCRTKYVTGDTGPIVVFRFLYRSRDALKRGLIIPRSPTLSPVDSIAELSEADIQRLARERLKELKGNRVKREPKREPRSRVKRELDAVDLTGESRPAKRRQRTPDIVDLTALDSD